MSGKSSPSNLAVIFAAALVVLTVVVALPPWSQDVPFGAPADSCGIYCVMATDYSTYLSERSFDKYYFQKSAPAALVYTAHSVFGISSDATAINHSFDVLRAIALALTVLTWAAICWRMLCGSALFLNGTIALCINQMMLLDAPFAHEDPDPFSVLIAIVFMYFCLRAHITGMLMCIFLGSFIQPQCALLMLPIFLLHPAGQSGVNGKSRLSRISEKLLRIVEETLRCIETRGGREFHIWAGLLLTVFAVCLYVFPLVREPYVFHGGAGSNDLLAPVGAVLASVLIAAALSRARMLIGIKCLIVGLADPVFCRRLILVIALKLGVAIVVGYFGRGEVVSITSSMLGTAWLIYSWFFHAVQLPLKPWLAHFVYFGPVFLLVVIFWSRLSEYASNLGIGDGFKISLGLLGLLSINSESRHFVAFLPWLCVVILCGVSCKARAFDARAQDWLSRPLWCIGFLTAAFLTSRFYLSIGLSDDPSAWLATWGPWWSWQQYCKSLVIGLIGIVVGMRIWRYIFRS